MHTYAHARTKTVPRPNKKNNKKYLLASERSERDTYRGKNEKIGDVCLLASERSELDTIRGNSIEISLYLFIYLFMGYVRPLFSPALLIT